MDYQHSRPERLKTVGRSLKGRKFPVLSSQLQNEEELFAIVRKKRKIHAFWIHSVLAFRELKKALAELEMQLVGYCAVPREELREVSEVRRRK